MKKPIYAIAIVAGALSCGAAIAQSAPLRGAGLLALEVGAAHSARGGQRALVALPDDEGGGAVGARALRGADSATGSDDHTSSASIPSESATGFASPAAPAAATPKRPNYRWQSLVPGAIK